MLHSGREIVVVSEGFEAHPMLECYGERDEHVAEGDLGEQILRGEFWSFVGVDPDEPCKA